MERYLKKYQYQDGSEASGERKTILKRVRLVIEKWEREYNARPDDDPSPSQTPKQSMAA